MKETRISAEEYAHLKAADIRAIDPVSVPDISDVKIDPALPVVDRIRDAARQMNGNPFFYRCGGILVKTSFAGTLPLQEVLENCLERSE